MDYQSGLGRHRDPWREEEEHELRAQDLADKKNAALQKKEASQQIQPKLSNNADSIISPDDASEKEADAVSQKVTEGKTVDLSGISGSNGNPVSPKSNGAETPSLPDGFNEKMNQSSGSPMDDSTKTEMESKMGTDFSGVKIHSDSTSHHLAQSINAKAFTHGQDIYFGQGHSAENQGLLAHELVHTVQQGGNGSGIISRQEKNPPPLFDGKTNYKFDTYQITGEDLNDPEIISLLGGLTLMNKLVYLEKCKSPEVQIYLSDTLFSHFATEDPLALINEISQQKEADFSYVFNSIMKHGLINELLARLTHPATMSFWDYLRKLNDEQFISFVLQMQNQMSLSGLTSLIQTSDFTANGDIIARLHTIRGISGIRNRIVELMSSLEASGATEILLTLKSIESNRERELVYFMVHSNYYDSWLATIPGDEKSNHSLILGTLNRYKDEVGNPSTGVVLPDKTKKKAIDEILTPGVARNSRGKELPFVDEAGGVTYREDIIKKLDAETGWIYSDVVTMMGHTKFDWPIFDSIANEAKRQTDYLFGDFNSGPQLSSSGPQRNLYDRNEIAADDYDAYYLAEYLIVEHSENIPIYSDMSIHQKHNANTSHKKEKRIIHETILEWMGRPGNTDKLKKIEQGWPGEAGGGKIYLQRFKKDTDKENRMFLWDTFQTMIHEYLHTITSPGFESAAKKLGGMKESILTEGGTSYFTDIVWKTIYPDEIRANDGLRNAIEGKNLPFDETVIPDIESSHYDQIKQVRDMIPVIGYENFRLAYFKGVAKAAGI